jgi:hypothetical protein
LVRSVEIDQSSHAIRIAASYGTQLLAAQRFSDQHWLLDFERFHHREHIVAEPVRSVARGRSAGSARSTPSYAVYMAYVRKLRREVVEAVSGAAEPIQRDQWPA